MTEKEKKSEKATFTVNTKIVEPVILFEDVHKSYLPKIDALSGVNLVVKPGEFASIIGSSGAGKSTLARLITREDVATSGRVLVFGEDLAKMPPRRVPYLRRRIGVVFQDYKLLPSKTVWENVAFVLEAANFTQDEIKQFVPKVLELVGVEHKARAFPRELAGGEQQRVSIARAIVKSPKVLIADEPTGNLDPKNAWDILELLLKINKLGTTVLLTTHNKDLVNAIGRRVITISNGRIAKDIESGTYSL